MKICIKMYAAVTIFNLFPLEVAKNGNIRMALFFTYFKAGVALSPARYFG